ncbi:low molecular weight phosphatase family protein [Frigoribacterium sp. ACAM 257]|uniref:arsenate reductase/protein-tyrosine-phosphatase family protein n=1 Tax=Frigoribacterium sp. ACAM 257 TaxID=2508998 RepID=UPI00174AC269|nr:low molecular weight phosphatase family protein [Frigoribacterium sp. ACAM 257]
MRSLAPTLPASADARPGAIEIVTVCTGNICRSPFAEILLRDRLADLPVAVSSAGTRAVVGAGLPTPMALAVTARGLDPTHAARQLDDEVLRSPDLVLGLAREHRSAAAALAPRSGRRATTLLEFARVVEQSGSDLAAEARAAAADPEGRLRTAIGFVLAERGSVRRPRSPADDDVADPYGRDDKAYASAVAQIADAVETLADYLLRAAGRP